MSREGKDDVLPNLMQLAVEPGVTNLGLRNEQPVCDLDRVDDAVDLRHPEIQELAEPRIIRCDVVELPDEGLQQFWAFRQVVEDVGGGDAVAGLVAQKHGAKVYVAHTGFPCRTENRGGNAERQDRVHPTRLTSRYNILAASTYECCQAHPSARKTILRACLRPPRAPLEYPRRGRPLRLSRRAPAHLRAAPACGGRPCRR